MGAPVEELLNILQRNGHAMQAELEAEEQTSVVDLGRNLSQLEKPPPLQEWMNQQSTFCIQMLCK